MDAPYRADSLCGQQREDIQGIDELAAAIAKHQEYLRKTRAIDRVKFARVEQELGLIFKDELQKMIFKGLKGTGKKEEVYQQYH